MLPCRLRGQGLQCPPLWHDALRAGTPYVETELLLPKINIPACVAKPLCRRAWSLDSQRRLFPSGPGVALALALGGRPEEASWGACLQELDFLSQPRQHHSQGWAGRSPFLFVNSGHALLSPFLLPALPKLHLLWQGEGTWPRVLGQEWAKQSPHQSHWADFPGWWGIPLWGIWSQI